MHSQQTMHKMSWRKSICPFVILRYLIHDKMPVRAKCPRSVRFFPSICDLSPLSTDQETDTRAFVSNHHSGVPHDQWGIPQRKVEYNWAWLRRSMHQFTGWEQGNLQTRSWGTNIPCYWGLPGPGHDGRCGDHSPTVTNCSIVDAKRKKKEKRVRCQPYEMPTL